MVAEKVPHQSSSRKRLMGSKFGYTNESNPFGDSNLSDKFVWRKRVDLLKAAGQYKYSGSKFGEKAEEIEAVKARREEREKEEAELDVQRAMVQKEQEQQSFADWIDKEEVFHYEQLKLRSRLRVNQGREKVIDLFARAISVCGPEEGEDEEEEDNDSNTAERWRRCLGSRTLSEVVDDLEITEIEDLLSETQLYMQSRDKSASGRIAKDLWECMEKIAKHALEKRKCHHMRINGGVSSSAIAAPLGSGRMIPSMIRSRVETLLGSLDDSQLFKVEQDVVAAMEIGDGSVDTEYWEGIQDLLPLFKARKQVSNVFAQALVVLGSVSARTDKEETATMMITAEEENISEEKISEEKISTTLKAEIAVSPVLSALSSFKPTDVIIEASKDHHDRKALRLKLGQQLKERHKRIFMQGKHIEETQTAETAQNRNFEEFVKREKSVMANDEEVLLGEHDLERQHQSWEDKCKLRKPRFFNRVKSGYDWNKYNQTHYDHDNPPPKMVQGYKFNIFYPDLINPTIAPSYKLEASEHSLDTVLIRFHAGPPYEDVAFKILKREWELCHRRGFHCLFDRGVLQLYFNFKRYRYRR